MLGKGLLILVLLYSLNLAAKVPYALTLSADDAAWIGEKIWFNECKKSVEDLTYWKEHEAWASVGIGHWIWHPAGANSIYQETIQELFAFMAAQGKPLPKEFGTKLPVACPWRTREQFIRALNTPKMIALRSYLHETIPLQTTFIIKRLEEALKKVTAAAQSYREKRALTQKLQRLLAQRQGIYALIDYLNFKGEGLGSGNYSGHKWGLLQVLQTMRVPSKKNAVSHFVGAAKKILQARIDHCPPERKKAEEGWREGWFKRLDSYTQA